MYQLLGIIGFALSLIITTINIRLCYRLLILPNQLSIFGRIKLFTGWLMAFLIALPFVCMVYFSYPLSIISLFFNIILLFSLIIANLLKQTLVGNLASQVPAQSRNNQGSFQEVNNNENQTKNEFIAMLSHEIRTPLAAIIGYSDLLLMKLNSHKEFKDIITSLHQNSRHLNEMINDILDISRIESRATKVEPIIYNLANELESLKSTFKLKLMEKALDFDIYIDADVPEYIKGCSTLIRQILINLIGNATKFTQNGVIKLKVQKLDTDKKNTIILKFLVFDSGCGIKVENYEKIFEPYTHYSDQLLNSNKGTGLGLNLSRTIARKLGGDVILLDSQIGQGSVFEATVKVEKVNEEKSLRSNHLQSSEKMKSNSKKPLQNIKVLLIEDSFDLQILFRTFLAAEGAEVIIASDGCEGLELARKEKFDIILMDIEMPVMNGYQTAKVLREEGYTIPIIALTAHAIFNEREKCLSLGFNSYKTKPLSPHELTKVVHKWAKQKNAEQRL